MRRVQPVNRYIAGVALALTAVGLAGCAADSAPTVSDADEMRELMRVDGYDELADSIDDEAADKAGEVACDASLALGTAEGFKVWQIKNDGQLTTDESLSVYGSAILAYCEDEVVEHEKTLK